MAPVIDVDFELALTEEVRKRFCLYSGRATNFERDKAWEEIAEVFGGNAMDIKKRWRRIRQRYSERLKWEAKSAPEFAQHLNDSLAFLRPYMVTTRLYTKQQKDDRENNRKRRNRERKSDISHSKTTKSSRGVETTQSYTITQKLPENVFRVETDISFESYTKLLNLLSEINWSIIFPDPNVVRQSPMEPELFEKIVQQACMIEMSKQLAISGEQYEPKVLAELLELFKSTIPLNAACCI